MLPTDKLSNREKDVIGLLLQGMSNQQIAIALSITERTVEFHLNHIYLKLGVKSRTEAVVKLAASPVVKNNEPPGDEEKSAKKQKIRMIISSTIVFTVLLAIVVLVIQSRKEKTWVYEREAEFPDGFTVGREIDRSQASNSIVYGQFGARNEEPWPAQSGFVEYSNLKVSQSGELYLQLWYSKSGETSVPILIFLDQEQTPRKAFYPSDQGDWNSFTVTEWIPLGKIEQGIHSIRFYTDGQEFGVADLDKFILTNKPPQ